MYKPPQNLSDHSIRAEQLLISVSLIFFSVSFLRTGFRMVVFSVVIMVVVLFFRKGIMGDNELPDLLKKWQKKATKEAVQP